jgi:hypothetical protein
MSDDIKENLGNSSTWLRIAYMVLFAIIFYIVELLIAAVVVFQVLLSLLIGRRNERALQFGAQLGMYAYQILQYLTYNSDEAPFPFADWPSGQATEQGKSVGGGD